MIEKGKLMHNVSQYMDILRTIESELKDLNLKNLKITNIESDIYKEIRLTGVNNNVLVLFASGEIPALAVEYDGEMGIIYNDSKVFFKPSKDFKIYLHPGFFYDGLTVRRKILLNIIEPKHFHYGIDLLKFVGAENE